MDLIETPTLNVLDPNDKLMNKFQKTLHAHLTDVNNRLSEDIFEFETSIKQTEKELESKGVYLYQIQQEIDQQHATILQYMEALTTIASLREKRYQNIEAAKEVLKENRCKLKEETIKKEKLSQELKTLLTFYSYLSKWEEDLNIYLKKSKQISSQDAKRQKMLINKKQQRDFTLYRLKEEVWRIEAEIAYLDEQVQIKSREKEDGNRVIIDVNIDLETLHTEHKDLHNIWKSIVANICKRNNFHNQLCSKQGEVQKLCDALLLKIHNVKRETEKETEINEHLTSLCFRLENDIKIISKVISVYNEKIANIELQLLNLTKVDEQMQCDYNIIFAKYQNCLYEEEQANKKFEISFGKKKNLEDMIIKKLEEKVICDKTAQYVNESLLNMKNAMLQHEITVARIENLYGDSCLKLEKLTNFIINQKTELEELLQKNGGKAKQIDELQKEIKKYETTIERKQRKLLGINKLIKQIAPNIGSEDLSPQDLKIISLEKNIQELVQNTQKAQQFWMRQQGFMVSLSQQKESQLQELNLLDKEIMIMEQKNVKLEFALEMLTKEEASIDKIIVSLRQKVSHINADLVVQKDLTEELEDKNCIIKNECILSFEELELELIKLQSNLKNLCTEKIILKEELKSLQQESLSWEKKVQLLQETIKQIKEERSAGGIAPMKNEIHKMEMRLSYLRRIQEKLIHDMELCIGRRDIIVTKVIGKLKKNPKELHHEKLIMHKRLFDQRAKIKHFLTITKQTGDTVEQLKSQISTIDNNLTKCKQDLQNVKEYISNIENEIEQLETLKYHNLHSLVLKQRKVKQFQNIKNGTYKMIYRNENVIEENMQIEHTYRQYLKYIIEKTDHDFPMLQVSLRKILLILQIL